MPWKVYGNCVHKENADGSKGELVKCHENSEEARRHAKALYANVHESVVEFSMAVTKANVDENGFMRWRSVNSDIDKDYYGEKMSKELFEDFLKHVKNNEPIPDPFREAICEEDWCGGMPYLSLAHYKSGKGKANVPGEPQIIYMDGKALKSKGVLYDTPLGKAVFKSLRKDIEEKSDSKIRISIGFLDLEHSHGDKIFTRKALGEKCPLCADGVGDKIYRKGHLVHLALTRVPANPRTDMELEMKSITKEDDAKSIVQDDEVFESLELKSQTEEAIVIKAEEEKPAETPVEQSTVLTMESTVSSASVTTDQNGTTTINIPAPQVPVTAGLVAIPEPTPLEKSFAALKERVAVIKSQGLVGDAALKEIQGDFDKVGEVLKSELTPPPTPEQVATQNLEATLRSLLSEMLPQALAQTVAPIQSELSELRALSLVSKPQTRKEEIPQPRSLSTNLVQKQAIEQLVQKTKKSQFDMLAEASVGLPVQ